MPAPGPLFLYYVQLIVTHNVIEITGSVLTKTDALKNMKYHDKILIYIL